MCIARSKARTVFARSNTEIVGSNPTGWMDVCVLCVRLFCIYIVSGETVSRPKKVNEDLSLDKPLQVIC
jgi:hypothetical protein